MRTASTFALILAPALILAGCQKRETAPPVEKDESQVARAILFDTNGQAAGEAILAQGDDGLLLTLNAVNIKPGEHGVHVHETGTCTAPDFKSAGGHWNPTGKQHGLESEDGSHFGDLPNLSVGEGGIGSMEATISKAVLQNGELALMDADGAAFVIHEGPDDQKTDPSGDSGSRVACGEFEISTGGVN